MKRRQFISLLGGAVFAYPLAARAQQSHQLRRIGVLMATFEGDRAGESRLAAFRAELAKLGWIEDRNLRIDVRWGATPAHRSGRYGLVSVKSRQTLRRSENCASPSLMRSST